MKELGYEIDKRQVAQMIEFLDENGKGIITKDAFLKFMTARMVGLRP
jgi:Ca2+-binding EF-hand superfamily protein